MSVSEAKENRTVSLDTFTENTVIGNSKHFFCGNSTFEVEESVIVNTEKSSNSPFTKAFNDEIEKVKNEIDKLIIALTQMELDKTVKVDVLRSQRSISSNTINNPNPSGSFTRPNLSSKAAKLENEMRKMKEDIAQLKQSFTIGSGDKERLASLETTIETLKRLLDDQSRETEQKIANLESLVESLINVVNIFRKELDDMKKKAAEQETIQKQKGLPTECVEAIKSHNFKVAEEKLQEINDNSKINLIIKEVYNYQIANFDLVLKLGDDIQNIERSFLVYKALNYEMESSGHNDNVKVKKLIKSLERKIINQENTSSGVKKEAYSLTGKLIAKVSERNINPWLYKAVSNLEVFKPFVDAMEERGISVSTAKDNDGDSLLHKAAMNDHLDVVKYLINEKRVDVNAKNYLGSTPLHYATLDGHLDIIRYFIDEKHVDVNVKNYLGSTPLHYAALNGHLDVVKYFVDEKHADFNAKSDVGFTLTLPRKSREEVKTFLS